MHLRTRPPVRPDRVGARMLAPVLIALALWWSAAALAHADAAPPPAPAPAPGAAVPAPGPTPSPAAGTSPRPRGPAPPVPPVPPGPSTSLPAPEPLPSPNQPATTGPAWYDIPGQVQAAIDGWFGGLVKSALTPVMGLIGRTLLSTPDATGGRTAQLWAANLALAGTCYVLFAVIGGVIVMTHESVQTRHGLKQVAPRLVFGLIAASTSLYTIRQALTFGNALTQAVWGQPLDPAGIGNAILGRILDSIFLPTGVTQIFNVLFGLVLAVLACAVLFSFALRTAGLMLLTVSAPLALSCHALPQSDGIARLWWRCLAAVFGIQLLQALALILCLQVFFDPHGNVLGVPTTSGLTDLLVCGALFVILLKIPGWVMRVALGRQPGSAAAGVLKTAAAAAVGTAIGLPGAGSARAIAGRAAGKAVSGRLGAAPGAGRRTSTAAAFGSVGVGTHNRQARTGKAAPRFGATRGRPTRHGQLPLFPVPPGSRVSPLSPEPAAEDDAPASATSGPGWRQTALFPAVAPGPIRHGRQLPLFPVRPDQRARTQNPASPPGVGVAAPAPSPHPRAVQPGMFPRSGVVPAPASAARVPVPVPVRAPRAASPPPPPRAVRVYLATAPAPPKPARKNTKKRGE